MLNPALQVLLKDGTIVDNTYQLIAEDGIVPQGDVVVTTAQLDQLENIQGKKALYITVDDSPETHEFPLSDFRCNFD
jgi:predicted GTPase